MWVHAVRLSWMPSQPGTTWTMRYLNDERGLEQGFTLQVPPTSSGGGRILLELGTYGKM